MYNSTNIIKLEVALLSKDIINIDIIYRFIFDYFDLDFNKDLLSITTHNNDIKVNLEMANSYKYNIFIPSSSKERKTKLKKAKRKLKILEINEKKNR